MLTNGYFGRQTQRERDAANQQLAAIDNQLGVGPWGQSLSPYMQEHRDNYQLMANDPQAMHRKAVEAVKAAAAQEQLKASSEQDRLNPFTGRTSTSVMASSPGKPMNLVSISGPLMGGRGNRSTRFPNPFE